VTAPAPILAPAVRPALPWSWGATGEERAASFPCDGALSAPDEALIRAVDVAAPAPVLFRWLCQLRAGPYSYDWIDNGFRRSPRRLSPGLEALAPGQRFCRIFELDSFVPGSSITLRMTDRGAVRLFGEVAVTYAAEPAGAERSRLVAKLLVRYPRRGAARAMRFILPWGDLVMMRKQLLTLGRLAEGGSTGSP
jgi:hypothetical protein